MRERILRLNASLAACVRAGDPDGALLLFRQMLCHGLPLDGFSFTSAFSACPALHSGWLAGRQLHALAVKSGTLSAPITRTALLGAYAKCPGGTPDDAVSVFAEISSPDAVAWNALLSCLVRHGRAADAVAAFRKMARQDGVRATGFTLAALLKACGALGTRRRGEQVHAAVVVAGAWDSAVLGTALMDFYSDCGLIDSAVRVFDLHLPSGKDEAAWNALIAGCVRNGRHEEAFAALRDAGLNATALTAALSACSVSCNIRYGREIHGAAVRRALTCGSTALCNGLSDMYSRCGKMEHARFLFDQTPAKDVVSWSSLIRAYGSHGRAAEAVMMFREMEEGAGGAAPPNASTLLSVLYACAHAGLVAEGRECFLSMKARHGVEPGPEHEACFIDLLGRAGRMDEAWEMFAGASGGAGPDLGVCVAMLNACAANMDVERGLRVAERLLGLARVGGAGVYVALSNFYAGVGQWDKAEEMRRLLREGGLRKELGCSRRIDAQ